MTPKAKTNRQIKKTNRLINLCERWREADRHAAGPEREYCALIKKAGLPGWDADGRLEDACRCQVIRWHSSARPRR